MTKVLIVDDSAFMRQMFKKAIAEDPTLTPIGPARNGKEALELIEKERPDVITLDIEMPIKNGLETLAQIVNFKEPIPTIMVSAVDDRETVLKALELGAFDFIPKPARPLSSNINEITADLIIKIKAAAALNKSPRTITVPVSQQVKSPFKRLDNFPIIAIGTSSGGPKALKEILPAFPGDIPAAIVVVQHMPAGFTASLAKRLNQDSQIQIKEAAEKDLVQPGLALIAPGDYHMEIDSNGQVILNQSPPKWGVRPCVDYLFISASQTYTNRIIGVILTGMGSDGAEGMTVIKENNGYGIVEDESTALVYGMPGTTIKANAYDEIIPLDRIPSKIIEVIERRF